MGQIRLLPIEDPPPQIEPCKLGDSHCLEKCYQLSRGDKASFPEILKFTSTGFPSTSTAVTPFNQAPKKKLKDLRTPEDFFQVVFLKQESLKQILLK